MIRALFAVFISLPLFAAGSFNGSTSIGTKTNPVGLDNLPRFTYCAWIRPINIGEVAGRILVKGGGTGIKKNLYLSGASNGIETVVVREAQNSHHYSSLPVGFNTWSFVCSTFSPETGHQIWRGVSGGSVSEFTPYGFAQAGSGNPSSDAGLAISVGNNPAQDRTFNGSIAEVSIYDRVLNSTEMTGLMRGFPVPGLTAKAYWPFYVSNTSTEMDRSGNGNDLTLISVSKDNGHAPIAPSFGWFTN